MDTLTEPEQPDLSLLLPRDVYYQLVHKLCATLAPVTNSPEDLARRDNAAIAQVASLLPANADEANLAAQYVAANAYAMDCLRLAQEYATRDHKFILKCGAQAATMLRQAQNARSLLQRVQAERRKREADSAAADQAAWTEHCAIGLMTQALGRAPPAPMAEAPPALAAPEPARDEAPPPVDPIMLAEQYAVIYPERAVLIRRLGGLPDKPTFGPPEDYLVRALVTGRTPALLALDRQEAAASAV